MSPEPNALEALKAKKAIERDRERLSQRFEGVAFEELGGTHRERALERFDAFLVASDPVATCPLTEPHSLIAAFGMDEGHAMAIRLDNSESGAWFVMSDPGAVLGLLKGGPPEGLALYDGDADVLYAVHEAEYEWEYYEIR